MTKMTATTTKTYEIEIAANKGNVSLRSLLLEKEVKKRK